MTSSSFSSWQQRHRDRLLATSLPAHAWRTPAKWSYFLEHGDLPADSEGPAAHLEQLTRDDVVSLIIVIDDYEQSHPRAASSIRALLIRLAG